MGVLLAPPVLPERPLGDWNVVGAILLFAAIAAIALIVIFRTWARERNSPVPPGVGESNRHEPKAA